MEAVAGSDPSGTATSLLQVSMRRPDCGVVCHVVVRGEEFDLCSGEWERNDIMSEEGNKGVGKIERGGHKMRGEIRGT